VLGVILCGGSSSRMGEDKGLLLFNNKTWAQLAQEKLTLLQLQTVLSVGLNQFKEYNSIFPAEQLVVDDEGLDIAGPLRGLLSVHKLFLNEDLLVLACDMPQMNQVVVDKLREEYFRNSDCEAIVYKFAEQIEPLCGIYTQKGIAKISEAYSSKNLAKHSMMYVLEQLQTMYVTAPENWKPYFKNFNSPTDFYQ
jgi:molybdenum cofactor guanylyltransferase